MYLLDRGTQGEENAVHRLENNFIFPENMVFNSILAVLHLDRNYTVLLIANRKEWVGWLRPRIEERGRLG